LQEPTKNIKEVGFAQFHVHGDEIPWLIVVKFCTGIDVRDGITYAKFGEDRLRGFGGGHGSILRLLIDFHSRSLQHPRIIARMCDCVTHRIDSDEYTITSRYPYTQDLFYDEVPW